jgi:hypothetical protein
MKAFAAQIPDLGNETECVKQGNDELGGITGSKQRLINILIAQARREDEIIEAMKQKVLDGDKDGVFQLAKELTCISSNKN